MANNHSPKIVFLVPYFGKLPSYFDVFIQSAANKNFDIFFFSDCDKPEKLPANCTWQHCSFNKIQKLFSEKLDLEISFKNPQKLCDFKPALGLIFNDSIKSYDFWGSADMDLCIGNFEKYLNEAVCKTFDVFSGIKEYVSGSFFIVRNNEYCNSLFKKSKDWQRVFLTEENMIFDECGGPFFKQLKAGKTFGEIKTPIESFTEVLFKEDTGGLRLVFENVIAEPRKGITMVEKNAVSYNKQEYLLVHYIYYKTWYSFFTNKKLRFPFYINRLGFFQNKPSWIIVFVSKNFWIALYKKIHINLKKLIPGA